MRRPLHFDIPIRYKSVYKSFAHHFRLISFREKYYSDDKGWRYHWDKYIEEDQKDFPIKQAEERFESIIKTIKENFPERQDRHIILTHIKPAIVNFNIDENKKNAEYIESAKRQEGGDNSLKYKREIEISTIIRETYTRKYNEYEYIFSERKLKDDNESEFIDRWINGTVTADDWFEYRYVDYWTVIDQLDLTVEEIEEIENIQYSLFFKHVNKTVDIFIEKYSTRSKAKRIEIIEKQLRDIKNFFEDGNTNESAIENLRSIYSGIRIPQVDLVKAYNDIVFQRFNIKDDLVLNIPGLHKSSPHFCAFVLFNYKEKAEPILKDLLKKDKPKKATQKSFNIKQPHKTEWLKDFLVELNFKIDLLKDTSSPDQLFDLLTSTDFSKIKSPIHFNCETKQFVYIIDKLKPKFSKLTYANIERSEKFVSSEGNLITADNISNSKTDYPKDKDEIDAVFNSLMN
jgi:hypothetical protein